MKKSIVLTGFLACLALSNSDSLLQAHTLKREVANFLALKKSTYKGKDFFKVVNQAEKQIKDIEKIAKLEAKLDSLKALKGGF